VPDGAEAAGQVFLLAGAAVFWSSNKQALTTLSSTESEYVALAEAGKEAIYIQAIIKCEHRVAAAVHCEESVLSVENA
jgi:hypothetical protein